MTLAELEEKVLEVIPTATLDFDNQGQIVVYTGLMVDEDSQQVIDYESEE